MIGVFIAVSLTTSHSNSTSVPEAISSTEIACPEQLPTHISGQFQSTATLYNTTLTLTRDPAADPVSDPPFSVSAVTTQTVVPTQATHCVAVRVPAAVAATLVHVLLAPTPPDEDDVADGGAPVATPPPLCVCANAAAPALPPPHPQQTDIECGTACSAALLKLPLNMTSDVYQPDDWHLLSLPEKIDSGQALTLTWVSQPAGGFRVSEPFKLPPCGTDDDAGSCSETPEAFDRAVFAGVTQIMPLVLDRDGEDAAWKLAVVAPPELQILWATEPERAEETAGALALAGSMLSIHVFVGDGAGGRGGDGRCASLPPLTKDTC